MCDSLPVEVVWVVVAADENSLARGLVCMNEQPTSHARTQEKNTDMVLLCLIFLLMVNTPFVVVTE